MQTTGGIFISASGAALLASVLTLGPVSADGPILGEASALPDQRLLELTANFGVTSDNIFRGFSQSFERPALQGSIDLSYRILYAGIWASGVDFGETPVGRRIATAEVDIYAGVKPTIDKMTFDLGLIYYGFPTAEDRGAKLGYWEFKLARVSHKG